MPSLPGRSAHLLHADEEQLDRAAILLRGGTAFVVAVCPAELRKAALDRLRGKVAGLTLPEPVDVGSAEESMDALIEQVQRRDRVMSLVLGGDVTGALDGLNLHREKVVRGGPVILWLENVTALVKMRERAPDAFSFRSTMVVVQGDGEALPAQKLEEPEAVSLLRKRLKRARTPLERADAGQRLAGSLLLRGRVSEAEDMARRSLMELPALGGDDEREVMARICRTLALLGSRAGMRIQACYWATRGLAEIKSMVTLTRELTWRVLLLCSLPGPFKGCDRSALDEALQLVRRYGLATELLTEVLSPLIEVVILLGDMSRARSLVDESRTIGRQHDVDRTNELLFQGLLEDAGGKLSQAETFYRRAFEVASCDGLTSFSGVALLVNLLVRRGELEAADRLIAEGLEPGAIADTLANRGRRAMLAVGRGDVEVGLDELRRLAHEAAGRSNDGAIFDACTAMVEASAEAFEVEALTLAGLHASRAEFDVAQAILLSLSGPDGPRWYPIQLLILRARVLALTPETLPQALDLDRQALQLARSTYPDLLLETGRSYADHLLRAATPDDALSVIADIEPYAAQNGFLKERARLLALRVLALVLRSDAPASIEPHLTALRAALAATASPRITAETLRDLAIRLPPATTTPDPLALAEEIHPLFVAMPMPAEDARCLELMGDVLLARGRPDDAKRRYLTARARLQRYGLGLRLPLLDRKIAGLP
jgi:tetratricopeptide (TPR) repeat protein